jgi:type IV pilus assembly protein PilV
MRTPHSAQRGILLLESLIAILLISFGILGLVALWANSVKNASEAKYRSDAAFLANELIAQMWLARPVPVGYTPPATWTARVAATLPGGIAPAVDVIDDPVVPGAGQVQATVTVNWQLPGHDPHSFVSVARINGAGPM